uniref:ATP-binding cassette, sub-family B (MDR/TAP), member 6b n=1 Tax=Cyprinus carpio TaxID=7962 RepID=A0A8C2KJS3_CYPCA
MSGRRAAFFRYLFLLKCIGAFSCLPRMTVAQAVKIRLWPVKKHFVLNYFFSLSLHQKHQRQGDVEVISGSAWQGFRRKVCLLVPYFWPRGSVGLQALVILCVGLLGLERVINVFVPINSRNIVNQLSVKESWRTLAITVCVYVLLKFLQGGGDAFKHYILFYSVQTITLRSFLWSYVQQYTSRVVQVHHFAHLHDLSLCRHLGRCSRDVLRSIECGTSSINNLLSTIADIIIAIIYFVKYFSAWFHSIWHLFSALTIIITEWRTKYRREINTQDSIAKSKAVDPLLNFELVKYYNSEGFEVRRFEDAILKYQVMTNASLAHLNQIQNLIIGLGLLAGSLLCAYYVTVDKFQVGDYVLFGTYINQLYTPLNWFGIYYSQSFLDTPNLFRFYSYLKDDVHAEDLLFTEGRVDFKNACFSYTAGTVLLTSILLFRFYDVQDGYILIDGQDIAKVRQNSLRSYISVVPQDNVLFNDNIRENIRYECISASDQEAEEAAEAELLAMGGLYTAMWLKQQQTPESEVSKGEQPQDSSQTQGHQTAQK